MRESRRTVVLALILNLLAQPVVAQDLLRWANILRGANIYGQDAMNTYLGRITAKDDPDSIFNTKGTFGSEFSPNSIWNRQGHFGEAFSPYSPLDRYSRTPPMIIKDGEVIGYVTETGYFQGGITLEMLREMADLF